jgi:2-polyprenyl-6-hydroxyphenyl methylase/3-demethylubiquinone-9 3-methyltransferase
VKDIFANVTYGHHWKEYSAREIKQYFETLSPDFDVEIGLHSYLPNNPLRKAISQCLGIFPIFRSDIEAVVRLSGKTGFTAKVPELPMMQKRRQDSSLE